MPSGLAIGSGSMDSVVLLYEYSQEIEHIVNFSYGAKHNEREREFALLCATPKEQKKKSLKLSKVRLLNKANS